MLVIKKHVQPIEYINTNNLIQFISEILCCLFTFFWIYDVIKMYNQIND